MCTQQMKDIYNLHSGDLISFHVIKRRIDTRKERELAVKLFFYIQNTIDSEPQICKFTKDL